MQQPQQTIQPTIAMKARAAALLESHLRTQKAAGQSHVWLAQDALDALNQLPAVLSEARVNIAAPTRAAEATAAPPNTPAAERPSSASNPEPLAAVKAKAARLTAIRKEIEANPALAGMDTLRDTMVFATGNPDGDVMFVGEAPGAEEEKLREPFVGPAGQLLTKIIEATGLSRKKVYISNIVKFRPLMPNQTTGNRKPTGEEMAPFLEYVKREVEVVEPKIIVCLGGTAAEGLLNLTGSVSGARGRFHEFSGIPALVTFHPSYLLRNQALGERRKVWEDMMLIMDKLGMPISDKQRGYFLPK